MLYGDTLTLIKQKITNIVVFESICSRPKGVCLSGVMSSGVMSEWGFVQWGYVRWLVACGLLIKKLPTSTTRSVFTRKIKCQ